MQTLRCFRDTAKTNFTVTPGCACGRIWGEFFWSLEAVGRGPVQMLDGQGEKSRYEVLCQIQSESGRVLILFVLQSWVEEARGGQGHPNTTTGVGGLLSGTPGWLSQ